MTSHQQEGATVQTTLNGHQVSMQLDTGATVTLLSETTWEDIDCPKLQPSDIRLQKYSQQEIPLLGKCLMEVQCQRRSANLFAVMSKGDRQNLSGRIWIDALKLDLNGIYHMNQVKSKSSGHSALEADYSSIFSGWTGSLSQVKSSPNTQARCSAKVLQILTPSFLIKPAVGQDLERQQICNGVLQRIDYLQWATPIVVVPKPSNAVIICGNFSVTVYPQVQINQYPITYYQDLKS